jgi:hypothetical protein
MRKLFVLMLLVFLVGCVSIVDDKRLGASTQHDQLVGMKIQTVTAIVGIKEIREGKNVIKVSKNYPHFTTIDIQKEELSEIKVLIRVVNQGEQFSLWEVWEVVKATNDYPYLTQHCLYEGNRQYLELEVICPLNNAKVAGVHFEIRDKQGATRNLFGHVKYTLEGGLTADPK